jgi:hypothetical protein
MYPVSHCVQFHTEYSFTHVYLCERHVCVFVCVLGGGMLRDIFGKEVEGVRSPVMKWSPVRVTPVMEWSPVMVTRDGMMARDGMIAREGHLCGLMSCIRGAGGDILAAIY